MAQLKHGPHARTKSRELHLRGVAEVLKLVGAGCTLELLFRMLDGIGVLRERLEKLQMLTRYRMEEFESQDLQRAGS